MSKSAGRVLRVAYLVARRSLPANSHRCSPKKFTQHQLFACLVVKEFFRLDYRGVEALLAESDGSLVDPHEISRELDNYRIAMYHANILHATRKDFDFKASAARHKQNLKQGLERASQKRAPLKRGPLT